MTHDFAEYLILAAAAFLAGALNTVAGGGTFLTFPALVYIGVPAVAANATSAVAVFPGYLGGAVGFRKELSEFNRTKLLKIIGITAIGGLIGSLLLLVSSNQAFSLAVPFLLAFATLAFAFGDKVQLWVKTTRSGTEAGPVGILLVSIYGGYFNGGFSGGREDKKCWKPVRCHGSGDYNAVLGMANRRLSRNCARSWKTAHFSCLF